MGWKYRDENSISALFFLFIFPLIFLHSPSPLFLFLFSSYPYSLSFFVSSLLTSRITKNSPPLSFASLLFKDSLNQANQGVQRLSLGRHIPLKNLHISIFLHVYHSRSLSLSISHCGYISLSLIFDLGNLWVYGLCCVIQYWVPVYGFDAFIFPFGSLILQSDGFQFFAQRCP